MTGRDIERKTEANKELQYCWYVDGSSNDDDYDDDDDYPLSFCLCLCCLYGFVLFLTSQSDICSSSVCSSVRTSVCSSVSFCQLTLQLSLSKFCSLSIFSLLLVSGVSRMGRLTAPGDGEDNSFPLLPQGVHSLHLDAIPLFSHSLILILTKCNNSLYNLRFKN